MRVIIFGATGMVGQGAVNACLNDPIVSQVLAIGRTAPNRTHAKMLALVQSDLFDLEGVLADHSGYDACFFCLGTSSSGVDEASYARITYDLTLTVAEVLSRLNPGMTFVYVSGVGTDGTERGRSMWARVKGRTENALQRLPFKAVYLFRPGIILPLDGIRSKTRSYRLTYAVIGPLLTLLRPLMPNIVLTTDGVGRAMIAAVRRGASKNALEPHDIYALTLESNRDHLVVWHSFLTMSRMDARRRNARALRLRHSQSLANRRQRLSQAIVRSTIQRFGNTVNPFATSDRLTISTSTCRIAWRRPVWNCGPW